MSRELSNAFLAQIFGQNSDDPFLALLTLSHQSFSTIRLVNNTTQIVSNGNTFLPFPFKFTLPVDDGESLRELKLTIDNVGLELINELRSVVDPIDIKIELVLASNPDFIEIDYQDIKLRKIQVNKQTINGTLTLDDFLNTGLTGETYAPSNFPGLFG